MALAQETGKSIPTLIAEALEELEEHEHPAPRAHSESTDIAPLPRRKQSFGKIAAELLADVPEEVFDRLPTDGAAQHDHYIYGTPKRPA